MNQKKVFEFLNDLGKGIIKIGTLTPFFKAVFSTKGVVISAIVIHSILMVNYFPRIFSGPSLISLIDNRDIGRTVYSAITLFRYIFDIAVLVVVLRIAKRYLRNNALTVLDIAKKQGILSESEHSNKVSELHHTEILENIHSLEKAGLYEPEKRQELESMVSDHYEHKKKIIAIEKAYADGVLTAEEYKEKIKQ